MGNAGRVLMIPKGEYNSATTYEMLDFVYYQGRSYVCKQTSTGNVPTNTTYWQALTGDASAEIQALTNKLEDEAETRAALGAHNLLNNVSTTETFKGILFTVNSDKTITANETSNGSGYFFINNNVVLDPGQYILSDGVGTIITNTTPYIRLGDASNNFVGSCKNDNHGLFAFTVTERSRYQVSIAIGESGLVANNITYKPMIRLATDADPTYQPYAKTNVELTQDVAGLGTRSGVTTGSTSVPNNAWTNIASVTVPTGPCLLHARVNLTTEPTAFEIALSISSSSTSSSTARNRILTGVSSTITDTAIGDFLYLNNSSETTEYLWFKHNKGDAITAYPTFEVIQL